MIWPIPVLIPTAYMISKALHGSPDNPNTAIFNNSSIVVLAIAVLITRRRMEFQERQQFLHLKGLAANVSDLRNNLSHVEARLNAMRRDTQWRPAADTFGQARR